MLMLYASSPNSETTVLASVACRRWTRASAAEIMGVPAWLQAHPLHDSLPRRFRSVSKQAEASVAINSASPNPGTPARGAPIRPDRGQPFPSPLGEPEPLRRGLVERGRDSALMRRPAHCCSGLSACARMTPDRPFFVCAATWVPARGRRDGAAVWARLCLELSCVFSFG